MKQYTCSALLALALSAAATTALAQDVVEGTVLAYDRKANLIVLQDKSVFPLASLQGEVPDGLAAGDQIEIAFESNEDDGIYLVHSVKTMP